MRHLFKTLALGSLLGVAVANAELVWTPEKGWEAKDGVVTDVLDASVRESALELMNRARTAQEDRSWYSALTYYNRVIERYPSSQYAAEAHFQKGVVHLRRNQFERSFNDFAAILEKFPDYARYDRVVQGQYDVAMAIKRGERPWLWGWIPWFKDSEAALDYFQKVHDAAPAGERAEQSLYYKGEWARELDKDEDAIDAYEHLIYDYPSSTLTPPAYLAMAEVYSSRVMGPHWDQGSTRSALNFYRDFVDLFPADPYAPQAQAKVVQLKDTLSRNRLELGKFYYYRRNNGRAAAIFFNEAVNAAPDSSGAIEARALLAKVHADEPPPRTWLDYILGRYPKSDAGDFVDAQSQQNLQTMGFRKKADGEIPAPASDDKTPDLGAKK